MTENTVENLLARLAARGGDSGAEAYAVVAATPPEHVALKETAVQQAEKQRQDKLDQLLGRIAQLTGAGNAAAGAADASHAPNGPCDFFPAEPTSFRDAKLAESEVEELAFKYLLSRGDASGRDIAEQIKLPFVLLEELLRQMKQDQWLVHRGAAPMNDYQYQLTDMGRERARRLAEHCTYFGAAPVALSRLHRQRRGPIAHQAASHGRRSAPRLRRSADQPAMLDRLGPAINSGRGLFLYGAAGNGKTSIAERVTRAFGQYIWIPRAIGVDGEIIRLFDPSNHEEAPLESTRRAARQAQDRQALDSHSPPDDRRRRRIDDGQPGSHAQHIDRHLRSAAATQEQLRHAGDRRLRPPADEHRRVAQSLDRAAGKAVRLSQPAQRQEDSGAVRSADHLFDEPRAEATWSTTRFCAAFPTRST